MRVVGLIGGMSWESSSEYYRIINQLVAQRLGGLHSARTILYSLDFQEIERAQHRGRWNDALAMLVQAGNALETAGADFLVLCTNTMHKVADRLAAEVGLPLLHIVDPTGETIKRCGLRTVGLLGTRFTMEDTFYVGRLKERFGIETLVPSVEEQATIDRIIYDELCKGIVKSSSRRTCATILRKLTAQGAEGIILGCTELPLLVSPTDVSVPLFDTTRLHAEAAVNLALTPDEERAVPSC